MFIWNFKQSFFSRLYRENVKLFWGFIVFSFLTLIANLLGDEVTPFFVYGMYSQREERSTEYQVVQIIVNDSIDLGHSNYSTYNKAIVQKPIFYYAAMKHNNGTDPTILFLRDKLKGHYSKIRPLEERLFNTAKELSRFEHWYLKYLEQCFNVSISSLNINMLYVRFTDDQKLVLDSTKSLIQWNHQQKL